MILTAKNKQIKEAKPTNWPTKQDAGWLEDRDEAQQPRTFLQVAPLQRDRCQVTKAVYNGRLLFFFPLNNVVRQQLPRTDGLLLLAFQTRI